MHTSATNVDHSSNGHMPLSHCIYIIVTSSLSDEKEKEKQQLNLIVYNLKGKDLDIEETKEQFQK